MKAHLLILVLAISLALCGCNTYLADEATKRGIQAYDAAKQAQSHGDSETANTYYHQAQQEFQTAVDNATRRKLGEQWAWSRKSDADITPLVAVTLARFALVNGLTTPTPKAAIH